MCLEAENKRREETSCSVGWFVSLLVRLCEREVLLAGLDEQCFLKGLASPSRSRWMREQSGVRFGVPGGGSGEGVRPIAA